MHFMCQIKKRYITMACEHTDNLIFDYLDNGDYSKIGYHKQIIANPFLLLGSDSFFTE